MPVKSTFLWRETFPVLLKAITMLKPLVLLTVPGIAEMAVAVTVVVLATGTVLTVVSPTLPLVMSASSALLLDLRVLAVMLAVDKTAAVLATGTVPTVVSPTLPLAMNASSALLPDLKVLVVTLVRDVVLALEEMVIGIALGKLTECDWVQCIRVY